jgi:predicted dehydrogenase
MLRFADGLCAHFDCSQDAVDVYDYIEVMGSEGFARSEWRPNYRLIVQSQRLPKYSAPRVVSRPPQTLERATIAELAEFASSMRESRQPSVAGTDALRVLEVLDAIALSAERGQPVSLEGSDDP